MTDYSQYDKYYTGGPPRIPRPQPKIRWNRLVAVLFILLFLKAMDIAGREDRDASMTQPTTLNHVKQTVTKYETDLYDYYSKRSK